MVVIEVIQFQTPTYGTHPVVHYSPQERPRHSFKAKHFFLLMENDKPTFAMEVYVYISVWSDRAERIIYVSKCDTVGMSRSNIRFGEISTYVLQWLVSRDLQNDYCQNILRGNNVTSSSPFLNTNGAEEEAPVNAVHHALVRHLHRLRAPPGAKRSRGFSVAIPQRQTTRICLFTRPAEQYLFPGSSGNAYKHTIDGQGLLRWWLNVLDPIVEQFKGHAHMTIPSSEKHTICKYLEPLKSQWTPGSLFDTETSSCIRVIPLLPDDPKGRFLEHLVVEHRYRLVSVSQFWQELGYRQEFQLGVLVGIIGVELPGASQNHKQKDLSIVTNTVSRKIYKKLVDVIKNSDFGDTNDVDQLKRRLTQISELKSLPYVPQTKPQAKLTTVAPVNDLSSMIKRKLAPTVNDLTCLVKRRKNK